MKKNNDLAPTSKGFLTALVPLIEQAKAYARQSKSEATKKAYKDDWKNFMAWCDKHGLEALPAAPGTIAAYISDLSHRLAVATIQRRLSSIAQAHRQAGHMSPTTDPGVQCVWQGIKRVKKTAQDQKRPLLTDHLRAIMKVVPDTLMGARDRAVLLLGIAGGFRRSELVSLDIEHIRFVDDGLIVTLASSKTDQEGRGVEVGIPYGSKVATCPVRSVKSWITRSGITTGPLFRGIDRGDHLLPDRLSDKGIARVVKRWASRIGVDPSVMSGHSLRSGLATQAALNNANGLQIAEQGRWRSQVMVQRYVRKGSLFKNNAAEFLGL